MLRYLPVISGAVLWVVVLLLLRGAFTGDKDISNLQLQQMLRGSVVKLLGAGINAGGGTGFTVKGRSGKPYTITNAHVCDMAVSAMLSASTDETGRYSYITIIEADPEHDLCLLTQVSGTSPLQLANEYEIGEEVAMMGHPLLEPKTFVTGFLSHEKAIQVQGESGLRTADCLRATTATFHGNSGSPVVDYRGDVVGVMFAVSEDMPFGCAVPLRHVKAFLSRY
jgi:serine protease Do